MNKSFISERLLPVDFIEPDDSQLQQDQNRLKRYLEANGKPMRDQFLAAGVLIPLVREQASGDWQVILTRRAEHLKHHPGEISFPGGRYEPMDKNLTTTAIRETNEEIGILAEQIEILGRLPRQATISQYHVTPFVGVVDRNYQLTIDTNEVSEAFSVPLNYLLDLDNQQLIERKLNGQTFNYYQIEYNQYQIWGATAQMLVRLRQRLVGEQAR